MRIVNFEKNGSATLGVRRGDDIVDLAIAAPDLPGDLGTLLGAGDDALGRAAAAAESAGRDAVVPLAEAKLLPPIQRPGKIICLGLNYVAHADEASMQKPDYPVIFSRFATSLVGPEGPLVRPRVSTQFDYEAELVAIIGKRGRDVPQDKALQYVAGYSCFNDGSVRDYQFKSTQWAPGKNFDSTGAFGPEFVTADDLPDGAKGLRIQTRLNGEVMQDADTADMVFDVAETISLVSIWTTLEPGDLLVMGTPSGVGLARDPQVWMKDGDVCEVEIENIGILHNPVVDQK